MIRKKFLVKFILLFAGVSAFCGGESGIKLISADLSGQKKTSEIRIDQNWKYQNGTLQNKNGNAIIKIQSNGWSSYELEFSVRRISELNSDCHFDLAFLSPAGNKKIYFRHNNAYILVPKLNIHEAFGAAFTTPLPLGPASAWTNFIVAVKGSAVTIKMNGKEIAASDRFPAGTASILFSTFQEVIELQNLSIRVFATTAEHSVAQTPSPNMAMNSGFEQCTLDNLPDFWGVSHWGLADAYWITHYDDWCKFFRTDTSTAWEGKRSMRLENPDHKPVSSSLTLISCNFRTKVGETYTFSAYMKTNRPGMKVRVYSDLNPKSGKVFALTPDWTRYVVTYTRQNPSLYGDMQRIQMLEKGVVWVDGIQLEPGNQATPYRNAEADKQLFVHEGNVNKQLYDVPEHAPQFLNRAPVMTGTLSDPVWQTLKPLPLQTVNGTPVKETASVRMAYTKDGLYLGLDIAEKDSNLIRCTKKKRDEYVWQDPSIEIFLDSKFTRSNYRHLAFNADGVCYDADNVSDVSWNGKWTVRTARKARGTGWTAEVFLPFCDMRIDELNGPVFGFNIGRNNLRTGELSCWAPTFGGFHLPLRFGHLKISADIQNEYNLGARSASFKFADDSQTHLVVNLYNGSKNAIAGEVLSRVLDRKGKEIASFRNPYTMRQQSNCELALPLKNTDEKLAEKVETELFSKGRLIHFSVTKIICEKGLDARVQYDYYTTEKELLLSVNSTINGTLLKSTKAKITITGEKGIVFSETVPMVAASFLKKIPIEAWPYGNYHAEILLTDGKNQIGKDFCAFRKCPPSPTGNEVKLDRFRRVTVVNGKPFIPLGFYWENQLTAEMLDLLGKYGVTAVQTYRYRDLLDPGVLEAAQRNHIMLMADIQVQDEHAREAEKYREVMTALKDKPEMLSWYSFDEIFTVEWGKNNYPKIIDILDKAQACDPYHPVVLLENSTGMANLISKNLPFPGKIPTVDCYAYPPNVNLSLIDRMSKLVVEQGNDNHAPAWIVLFASGYAFHASRDLTDAEHECQLYISLINGVRGVFYWVGWPKAPSSMKTIGRLFSEVKQIQDILLSTEKTPPVICTSGDIRFTVKKLDGTLYLIAVNTGNTPQTARFNFQSLSGPVSCEVLFENRKLALRGSCLEDSFEPLRRHVYKLPLP